MKIYKKKYKSKDEMEKDIQKIADKGGVWMVNGLELQFKFPTTVKDKFPNDKAKINHLKKKGNIITFFQKFATGNGDKKKQIVVKSLKVGKRSGMVKIEGRSYDTPWFDTMDDLIKSVDWRTMAKQI